jgi:hypothetical protein
MPGLSLNIQQFFSFRFDATPVHAAYHDHDDVVAPSFGVGSSMCRSLGPSFSHRSAGGRHSFRGMLAGSGSHAPPGFTRCCSPLVLASRKGGDGISILPRDYSGHKRSSAMAFQFFSPSQHSGKRSSDVENTVSGWAALPIIVFPHRSASASSSPSARLSAASYTLAGGGHYFISFPFSTNACNLYNQKTLQTMHSQAFLRVKLDLAL